MSRFKNLAGVLAVSAALTGGAVALGAAVVTTSANAGTVMGGYVGGGRPAVRQYVSRPMPVKARAAMKNKNKQWQRNRQHQRQNQFLLRDFTLILTPFQKSESHSGAAPYNNQWGQSATIPWNNQSTWTDTQADPRQRQNVSRDIVITATPVANGTSTPTPTNT